MHTLFDPLSNIEPNILVVFGILLLSGIFAGMVANRMAHLPTITAFMLIGVLIGPHGANILTAEMMDFSLPFIDVALGLILYKLGNMIHPLEILRSRKLTLTSLAESGLTFFGVAGCVLLFGYDLMVATIVGAIAISSSPAVLVHTSEELETDGPVTRRSKSLVAMNNLLSFLIFTAVLPLALSTTDMPFSSMILLPLYRFLMALVFGLAAAWASVQVARTLKAHDEHYRFAIIVGAIILVLGLSKMFHASMLFSTLILGVATRWFENRKAKLSHVTMGEGGDLFFIILFVMAGAKIDLGALIMVGALPLCLALVRTSGKFGGVFLLEKLTGYSRREEKAISLLLLPMAGMAIGLATTLYNLAPTLGAQVSAIVFAMIAVFETIGPFAAVKAFEMADEVGKGSEVLEKTPQKTLEKPPEKVETKPEPLLPA